MVAGFDTPGMTLSKGLFLLAILAVGGCDASTTTVLAAGAGAGGAGGAGASAGGGQGGGTSGTAGGGAAGGVSAGASGSAGSAGNGAGGASAGAAGGSGTGATNCKRGSAYGYTSADDLTAVSPGVRWWYNWSPRPDEGVASAYQQLGVEFVPMIWGEGDLKAERVAMIPPGSRYLLGFNEPNFKSQSNLSAKQAAALWPQVEAIAKARNLTLVSPALNFCGPESNCWSTDPFVWFDEFFASCPGCQVDHIAVHWYACSKDALSWYLGQVKDRYKRSIWLTEFSCLDDGALKGDPAKQAAYMSDALTLLEGDPMVFRYAWFSGRWKDTPAVDLLGSPGQLTALGQQYLSTKATCSP